MEPHEFARRVLLAVTGLTAQVVTETLYALAVVRQPPWVPTEIRIITTKDGADQAMRDLLDPVKGWFHRLLRDYSLPRIDFRSEHITVLINGSEQPISDIRTVQDNTRTADLLTEQVRAIT